MTLRTYVFVDAAYLNKVREEIFTKIFDEVPALDLRQVQRQFAAQKLFYYDCFDTSGLDYSKDVAAIHETPGVQLRQGTLSGEQGRRRQKEVDVLLTVDALTHAFNGNFHRAVLIAGDLDFRPLVDALVRSGIYVTLCSSVRSAARPLTWSADESVPLAPENLLDWSITEFRSRNRLPNPSPNYTLKQIKRLLTGRKETAPLEVKIVSDGRQYAAFDESTVRKETSQVSAFVHTELNILRGYMDVTMGPFEWEDA